MNNIISRRKWLAGGIGIAAGASGLAVAASVAKRYGLVPPDHSGLYGLGHSLTYASQRLLTVHSLAREFPRSEISKTPFANGRPPKDEKFKQMQLAGFPDWKLSIDGLVARPGTFTISDLRRFSASSQITHLACEEGWSFIAEWMGVRLSTVLHEVGILPKARFVTYSSFEPDWSDSIDMADALHPQTFITYGMNDGALPVGHGGPLRMRVPRQLGYKSVKYLTQITVTDELKGFVPSEYSWYAGM